MHTHRPASPASLRGGTYREDNLSTSSLTASELRKKRLAASSMSRSLADTPYVIYRPDLDPVQSPFIYESYSYGRRVVPIMDDIMDIDGSNSSVAKSKRYRSMMALMVFIGLTGILCFLDELWSPNIYYPTRNLRGAGDDVESFLSWFQQTISESGYTEEQKHRVLAILKTRWPECVDEELTSQECKDLIDHDIEMTFTGVDKNITSHIIQVRSIYDENYNLVVIQTTSARGGLVDGIFRDGMVFYHFDWNSTGEEATIEQQLAIPPVNGYIVDGINTSGSTIEEYIAGNATGYIAGGWYKDYYTNTDWGQAKLATYLSTNKTIDTSGVPRSLGPWDCAGITGESCCAMIKHDVRDADYSGSAIQCWVEEVKPFGGPLTRRTCEDDITKVCVYEKYDGHVLTVPIIAYDKVTNDAIAEGYNITDSKTE